MLTSRFLRFCATILLVCAPTIPVALHGQGAPGGTFQDPLLDKFVGKWHLTGQIMHQPADHSVKVDWVLNHSFLRVHEKTLAGAPAYEALAFVGWDSQKKQYIVHWMDIFGGHPSETIGHGAPEGNTVPLAFDYPEGAFRSKWTYDPATDSWHWQMENRNQQGAWEEFASVDLKRADQAPPSARRK